MERATFELGSGVFHALVGGPRDARPLIFLHGFPDHPPTAVDFLDRLARTHRVIAPWLRGYAPSPVSGPYDLATLARDVVLLIDRVARGPVDLVGHDWGAAITYDVCAHHPARIRRAVTMALPHLRTFFRAQRDPAQRRASLYTALFQIPGAGHVVRANDFAIVDRLWSKWSSGYVLDDRRRAELHACLATGWTAPLGYYRAWLRGGAAKRYRRALRRVSVPLLQLHGACDGCVLVPAEDDGDLFDHRVRVVLPKLGHFMQVEAPEEIADRASAWLA